VSAAFFCQDDQYQFHVVYQCGFSPDKAGVDITTASSIRCSPFEVVLSGTWFSFDPFLDCCDGVPVTLTITE
jgi:hypothetical protein